MCPLPPLLQRELCSGQECLITLGAILEDPQGEQELATSSPAVHPEQRSSRAQSSGMSQLNRQMQHHQLPPAHPSPSAPGKHLSTGREMPQVQALRGCLQLGSRLDSFFQNTQREKYKMQHPQVFPIETTAKHENLDCFFNWKTKFLGKWGLKL